MEPDLRSRILHLVEAYPGLHLRDIQRRADCSPMLAEYHLNVLEKLGLVTSTSHGRYRDFFPVRQAKLRLDRQGRRWLGLLRRPPILAIALLLLEHGSMRPMQVAEKLKIPSSTATYQIRVACDAGLAIQETLDGRACLRLADSHRVLQLLQAYHPTPDLIMQYAGLWGRVFAKAVPAEPVPSAQARVADLPPQVAALPGAAQAVFVALRAGPMTQKELCVQTGHARRTVYGALKALDAAGCLGSHVHMGDTRQTKYWLQDDCRDENPEGNE